MGRTDSEKFLCGLQEHLVDVCDAGDLRDVLLLRLGVTCQRPQGARSLLSHLHTDVLQGQIIPQFQWIEGASGADNTMISVDTLL